jgi:hypothetical protein
MIDQSEEVTFLVYDAKNRTFDASQYQYMNIKLVIIIKINGLKIKSIVLIE